MKRFKYILLSLMLFMFPVLNVLADTTTDQGEKKLVYIVGVGLFIIRIVVPVILIVIASFDLVKAMTQNDEREMKKVIMGILPKVLSAIMIFLLPSLVSLLLTLTKQEDIWNDNVTCLLKPFECDAKLWEDPVYSSEETPSGSEASSSAEESSMTEEEQFIKKKSPKEHSYKTPDPFFTFIYLTDGKSLMECTNDKNIVVKTNYELVKAVKNNGLYTREAVVSVAQTALKMLARPGKGSGSNYRIQSCIPYKLGGMYHRKVWGVNPEWGKNGDTANYGLDCRNFVNWVFKQAGLNLIRGFGGEGAPTTSDYGCRGQGTSGLQNAKPGDVLEGFAVSNPFICSSETSKYYNESAHLMLVLKNTGTGLVIADSIGGPDGGAGAVRRYFTYDELFPLGDTYYYAYSMQGIYDGNGVTCLSSYDKARSDYSGPCHMPKGSFDRYANEVEQEYKAIKEIKEERSSRSGEGLT